MFKLDFILHMLTSPNKTFQTVIKHDMLQMAVLIVFISTFLFALGDFLLFGSKQLVSYIATFPLYFIGSFISSWFSVKVFKSKGNFRKTLIVWGFANAPFLLFSVINVPLALIALQEPSIYIIIGLIAVVTAIWVLILDVKGFMIAHKVGVWKSIIATLLSIILGIISVVLV